MLKFAPAALLILAFAATTTAGDCIPPFKIMAKRDNDRVDVTFEKEKVTFSVQSPFGISEATIKPTGEKWPDAVELRLHLNGLEHFKVSNGKVTLEGSAFLQNGKPRVRLWKDGQEDRPLDANSPYWIDIHIVGGDGNPAKEIPLKEGYFALTLPGALFKDNPTITVSWINFYRS